MKPPWKHILWQLPYHHIRQLRKSVALVEKLGIADEIIPEPLGGAHRAPEEMANILKERILENIKELRQYPISELLSKRVEKFSKIGVWEE